MSRFHDRYIKRKEHTDILAKENMQSYFTGFIMCAIFILGMVSITLLGVALVVSLHK